MDNKKDLLKRLGNLLRQAFAEANGLKFYATADGATVEPDGGELKPGVVLNVKLPDGTMQPAPAGEIVMEDGTIVVVGADGVITEVKPKEEVPADPAQDMAKPEGAPAAQPKSVEQTTSTITMFTEEAKAEMKAMFAEVVKAEIEARFAEVVKAEKFSEVETGFADFKKDIGEKLTAISQLVEKIGSEPAAQSFSTKPKKVGEGKTDVAGEKTPLQLRIEQRKASQN